MVTEVASGYQMVPESARGCQRVPDGASGYQMVPEGARRCQSSPIGTVVAPGLGKASDLIFVTVSIAGVEVVASGRYRCHNLLLQVGMVPEMEGPPGSRDKVEGKDYWRWI